MQQAPRTPPQVEIQGAEVPASYYEWLVDRELVTFKSAENQDEVELTSIDVVGKQALEVKVQSAVSPADFVVVVFNELDAAGLPIESSATSIDCLRDVDLCKIDIAETSLTASIDTTVANPAIIVVHLMYVSDERSMDELDQLVGSWGAKVEG